MKKVHLSLTFTFILGLLVHTVGNSQGTPIFTGNAATDFITTPGYIHFNDFVYDVGLPPAAPAGTVTGWDMQTAFFYYDQDKDDLYVGVDFAGIFGDADGNGDPSTTSSWLSSLQGTDHPNLGDTEGFILAFDNGNDGNYDVYIGVSRMEDVTEFGIFVYTSDQDESPELFPVSPVGNVTLHSYDHNSVNPDLEFKVENISDYVDELCGVDFTIFAGSYEDGPIGEDHMEGKLELCLLPIELVSMLTDDGGNKKRKVLVEWTTATENNNDYFEVQHANDANVGFKTIGRVEGSGTKLTPTTYQLYHETPSKGNNYYRLKQVDMDGNEWLSSVITEYYVGGIGDVVDVYPNPNKGEFMLGLPDIPKDTEALISVIDGKGARVYEKVVALEAAIDSHRVNTYGLPQGIYHVSLTLMNSQNTYNESFIIR